MDPTKYRIPSGAKPATPRAISGSPPVAFPEPWFPQDSRTPRLTHTQSTPSPPRRLPNGVQDARTPEMVYQTKTQSATRTPIGHNSHRPSQSVSVTQLAQSTEPWQFPQPQVVRSTSHQSSLHPPTFRPRPHSSAGMHPTLEASHPSLRHKYSYSDSHGANAVWQDNGKRGDKDAIERSPSIAPSNISEDFSNISLGEPAADGLASVNALDRFQKGAGDDTDWSWHLLVTREARESLPSAEVMRQSAMFDLIDAERNYVNDLELVQDIFVDGLRQASPPILPPERLDGFVHEVFWNMNHVLAHHQRMLGSLFDLQREQHPILLSIGDRILDTVLKFQSEYESYIKHYPLAESLHRRELKANSYYRDFLEQCSQDPRLGKRELITFISRPVTRLPRLSLQLAEIEKRTKRISEVEGVTRETPNKEDHPDLEIIPIVMDVLNRFVKSTQPGIEASEGKVKFYALCESLKFRKGEIIDMDLYNENRTLVHSGPLARRQETWNGWTDLEVGLLDNYLLIIKPETRTGAKDVISRPIPLEYLRLGSFSSAPESRREERPEGGGLFDTIIKPTRPMFPFVISHASAPTRRYTLYATSESARRKWKDVFVDALGVKKVVMDANKWFAMNSIDDDSFRLRTALVPGSYTGSFTGKITSAVTFVYGGKNFIAVGTPTGVYIGIRGQSKYSKILSLASVTYMSAMQGFNKLLVLHNGQLLAYSLDLVARVGQGQAPTTSIDASLERLAKPDRNGSIAFFRVGIVSERTLVVYAYKSFLSFTLNALEAVADLSNNVLQRTNTQQVQSPTFRPYGETFYVPKEPFDVTLLGKTIAISTDRLMSVVDPTNLTTRAPIPIPDFSALNDTYSHDSPLAALKAKCDSAKPIGIMRSGEAELIVIYDEFGCYVTKHAVPTRKCGYVRWETKATGYAERGLHILLFSPQFLEIRHAPTGRLVQVLEGKDIRLLQSQPGYPLLIAMRGKKDDKKGMSDELIELVETAPLHTRGGRRSGSRHDSSGSGPLWDEWD
ncbi:hypothetical protein K439DRAFT_1419330 [Ramaria rubella]|nr:hypothetical protein K439DRAFT_1419330 [Ramaria rubella]